MILTEADLAPGTVNLMFLPSWSWGTFFWHTGAVWCGTRMPNYWLGMVRRGRSLDSCHVSLLDSLDLQGREKSHSSQSNPAIIFHMYIMYIIIKMLMAPMVQEHWVQYDLDPRPARSAAAEFLPERGRRKRLPKALMVGASRWSGICSTFVPQWSSWLGNEFGTSGGLHGFATKKHLKNWRAVTKWHWSSWQGPLFPTKIPVSYRWTCTHCMFKDRLVSVG